MNNAQEALYPSTEPYSAEKVPEFSATQATPIFLEDNHHENVLNVGNDTYHDLSATTATQMPSQFTQPVPLYPAANQNYLQEWQERRLSDNSNTGSDSLPGSITLSPSPHGFSGSSFGILLQQLSNGAPSQAIVASSDTTAAELEVSHPETTMSEWRTIPTNNSGYGLDMVILPGPRSGKRGPFKDLALREQTAQTRKIGSCVRCRMQRIRVSTC